MITYGLLYLLDSAKICQCGSASFGWGNAGGDLLVGGHLHVRPKFVIQLALNLLFPRRLARRLRIRDKNLMVRL